VHNERERASYTTQALIFSFQVLQGAPENMSDSRQTTSKLKGKSLHLS